MTRKKWMWTAVIVVLVAIAGYVGLALGLQNTLPSTLKVEDIDVSDYSREEATEVLNEEFASRAERTLTLVPAEEDTTADEVKAHLIPAASGIDFDVDKTLDNVTGLSFNPVVLFQRSFGTVKLDLAVDLDDKDLDTALKGVGESFTTEPAEGSATYEKAKLDFNAPVDGFKVDDDAVKSELLETWVGTDDDLKVPGSAVKPDISAKTWDEFINAYAQPLVDGPYTVSTDSASTQLSEEQLANAATIQTTSGDDKDAKDVELELSLDPELLAESLAANDQGFASTVKDASVELKGSAGKARPVVVPAKAGRGIDGEDVASAIMDDLGADQTREITVEMKDRDPEITTKDAEAWDVTHQVAKFATPYPANDTDRTKNLKAGASKVNGTVIDPGEEFNLNSLLAPITAENGYYSSGVVESGVTTNAMGGGLSQIATMSYNAGFLGGMEILEHKPHSRWFDRYPKGRESTYWEGQINVRWRNDTDAPVIVEMWVDSSEVKTRLWGADYYTVKTSTSDPYNFTDPATIHSSGPECISERGGDQGFTVDVKRTKTPHGGSAINESWSWAYGGWPTVICE